MEKRGQFTFYRSYYEAVKELPSDIQHKVLMALIGYGLDGTMPEGLSAYENAIFVLVKPTLDAGWKKAASGKFGGSKTKAKRKQNESKGEKERENEKENEKENEREIEKEIEKETEDECLSLGSEFVKFWEKYPVKIDPEGARAAYSKRSEDRQAIEEGLQLWLGSRQWQSEGGRFIPRAAKWLKERHYLQKPPQTVPQGATGELGQAEIEAIHRMMGTTWEM